MWRFGIIVLVIAAFGWIIFNSMSFQQCQREYQQQTQTSNTEKNETSVLWSFRGAGNCTVSFIKNYRDELLVSFTIMLAFATLALWVATRDLANDAAQSSKNALRAYVAVHHPKFGKPDPDSITIVAENAGQTPAHKIRAYCNQYSQEGQATGLPDGFKYADRETSGDFGVYRSVAVLHPRKEAPFVFPLDFALIERVRNKEISLFFYGHIDYVDAFGEQQATTFCYQYFPVEVGIGHQLVLYDEYNDAT